MQTAAQTHETIYFIYTYITRIYVRDTSSKDGDLTPCDLHYILNNAYIEEQEQTQHQQK